ncbi:MAG: hypothetical protein SU899_01890, partial [Chloroflexota bacterium]|nr:hypothetical protein [Chloroflexota bacterium]
MSQNIKDKSDAAEARTHETRSFMQQVRVTARRKYTPEEKVRIVLEPERAVLQPSRAPFTLSVAVALVIGVE